jgi:hypothetical protein
MFAASPSHTFSAFARQIDIAFARWDINHLHEFDLSGGDRVGPIDEDADEELIDENHVHLSRLQAGESFAYTFDLGDAWVHRCTVGLAAIDPIEMLGHLPPTPVAYFGWGSIPDQYGRLRPDE